MCKTLSRSNQLKARHGQGGERFMTSHSERSGHWQVVGLVEEEEALLRDLAPKRLNTPVDGSMSIWGALSRLRRLKKKKSKHMKLGKMVGR